MPNLAYLFVPPNPKPLFWVGSSLSDLREFPERVRNAVGYALHLAQMGGMHSSTKPLRGFGGAGVLEVITDFDGDTYRTVYTVRFSGAVYVLHAFQKKSRSGVRTPANEIALVRQRLALAQEQFNDWIQEER